MLPMMDKVFYNLYLQTFSTKNITTDILFSFQFSEI